jgi:signal transduction histidine kinase
VRDGFPGSAVRIEPELPSLLLDPISPHEIVANLIDNALKYSAPGAPVVVAARIEDDALVVRVSDQGPGIEPGDLPLIFDRFTQIDGSSTLAHGGVGLGLHLVRELTRRLGGDVEVDSVVERGTTFTVTIPAHRVPASADPTRPELSTA